MADADVKETSLDDLDDTNRRMILHPGNQEIAW
jgi:hypothetical protein